MVQMLPIPAFHSKRQLPALLLHLQVAQHCQRADLGYVLFKFDPLLTGTPKNPSSYILTWYHFIFMFFEYHPFMTPPPHTVPTIAKPLTSLAVAAATSFSSCTMGEWVGNVFKHCKSSLGMAQGNVNMQAH